MLQIVFDLIMIVIAYFVAAALARDTLLDMFRIFEPIPLVVTALVTIAAFGGTGVYSALLRFTSAHTLAGMIVGNAFAAAVLWASSFLVGGQITVVQAINFFFVTVGFTVGGRFLVRSYFRADIKLRGEPVIIYGSHDLGRQLLTSLQQGSEFNPVALLDEKEELTGATISGVRVYSPHHLERVIEAKNAKIVFIAMSEVSRQAQKDLADLLQTTSVEIQRIPAVTDVVSGRAKITDFKEVRIEDLLGREPVPPEPALMRATTAGKSVLVSGAGGSIGSEICRQILKVDPRVLVLVEQSEYSLYALEKELTEARDRMMSTTEIVAILGSISNEHLMESVMTDWAVDTVFHAAAYKHVPMLESNVLTAIENNVFGTETLVRAAVNTGVSTFSMVSTDKAVRPTNVMGATKRLAELICQSYAERQDDTTISMVRFGNVLGSSGSVIPVFRDQIAEGGPVRVTHPDITRYFMTIPEASQLVVQSNAMAAGGEVFVLDMGKPVRILNLAQLMIRLSGYQPWIAGEEGSPEHPTADDIEIVFSGLRPGEKLYEELLIEENVAPSDHPRIKMAHERKLRREELEASLASLRSCIANRLGNEALAILKSLPLDYAPADWPREAVARNRLRGSKRPFVAETNGVAGRGVAVLPSSVGNP
ncbi:polysaccharide biosynthesis protein [Pseudooceanicola batsensis]|uniref:polysaccharide biosynthesis protein n=1 Tax=Pseudooceanicola batsensis TaxID=314255 RepID=UPI0002EC40B1|nr:nucleoside-diphosphate sugar epimerase/dehydratase [Pseudooceanicola batsensis]